MRSVGLLLAAIAGVACGDAGGSGQDPLPYDAPVGPLPCTADTRSDRRNCGACGVSCGADQRCEDGACVAITPLDDYAGCRADVDVDANCNGGRRCLTVGHQGSSVCGAPCLLSGSTCPGTPAGSDARPTCVSGVLYCALACTATTRCPYGQSCRLLPPSMVSGYCAP